MPPSITFWNRLEPRPRGNSIAESLAASVRDPLWLLARQWQLGEFTAADCGSPVYVDLHAQAGPLAGWAAGSAAAGTPWSLPVPPLEATVESEPFTPDLATRVELGQWFEALLGQGAGLHMIDDLRSTYPLPLVLNAAVDRLFTYTGTLTGLDSATVPADLISAFQAHGITLSAPAVWATTPGAQWVITDSFTALNYAVRKDTGGASVYLCRDAEALRFLRVCAGRTCDGVAILAAAQDGRPVLTARREWTAQQIQALSDAAKALADAVREVYGAVGLGDPASWVPDRLSFDLNVAATTAPAALDILHAAPGPNGDFNWTSFDLSPSHAMQGVTAGPMTKLDQPVMPGHVRFRGMPNARWWEFETEQTDFGAVQPEKRDIAKLIFMDFMLIHGDDWYLVPLEVPFGSITQIGGLFVHDVFGIVTQIDRADATIATTGMAPGEQWTMFSPASVGKPPTVGSYLVTPPSAWPTSLRGPVIEEVRLLRDPVADLVWGVETTVESGVGRPWPGRERDRGGMPAQTQRSASGTGTPPLRYELHSPLPVNWIPFVAWPQPGGNGFVLERAVLPGDPAGTATATGRILQTSQLREQEVSTQGTVISRVVCRSRWIDGSTRLWIARRRGVGQGEASSGLRYDIAFRA